MTWMERHQIALYLMAIIAGFTIGAVAPGTEVLSHAINPAIALLLFATFLGVPFTRLARAFRDGRFLATLLALNFIVVPVVVFALSRVVAHEPALLVGVLLVLLTPCIDYVIVFSALAGAAHEKLLAAAPLLMLAQLLLLPVYLWAFAGNTAIGSIDVAPFVEAFMLLIALPLLAAALVQAAMPRVRLARSLSAAGIGAMVPLMVVVLFVVVASQAPLVVTNVAALGGVVAIYIAFLVIMAIVGMLVARVTRLPTAEGRALTFSGATRNSLVVLPLALALPADLSLVPAVVVTQTVVELAGMLVYVRLVPRLLPRPTR